VTLLVMGFSEQFGRTVEGGPGKAAFHFA